MASESSVIGLGVGAGAYVLARFALNHPELVDGLLLINITPNAEGLMDTFANKITEWSHTLPDTVILHLFGQMADCGGLPQVNQPAKVIEAFKYFIHGMGYLSSATMTRLRSRTTSNSSILSTEGSPSSTHTNEKCGRSHTDVSMESVSSVSQSISKSTEVAC